MTDFALQTTQPTQIQPAGPTDEGFEFVNAPYSFTQAGGHPWALTAVGEFAHEEVPSDQEVLHPVPTQDPKDIAVNLPPGLVGNPLALPRCPLKEFLSGLAGCPAATQLGVYRFRWFGGHQELGPIVNLTPESGQSAEFGLEIGAGVGKPVLTAHLEHTSEGYGIVVDTNEIPEPAQLVRFETTFWGVPADPSHDRMRGLVCSKVSPLESQPLTCPDREHQGGESAGVASVPFLTMPTDCSAGPETATALADSWEQPGHVGEAHSYENYVQGPPAVMPAVTGCDLLSFRPEIEVRPDTLLADEPVGLDVNLSVPLSETPDTNATPHLRDSVVTLPEGMSVSPGVVDGVEACDATGPQGINITGPESEEVAPNGELQLAAGHCPEKSSLGTAEAITPLLPIPVKGHLYLARPGCGGASQPACTEADALDGNLYRLYLELGGEGALASTGVHFKVPLDTEANPATGQLTSVVKGTPQVPFSELRLHLNGGPRAPLDNPAACGPATTSTDFTPWSAPGQTPEGPFVPGTPDASPSSFFNVEGCAAVPSLSPGFSAGTLSPQAAAFSTFTLNFTRQDREQYLSGVQVHTPPGLLGMLSSVPLCHQAEAQNGHCPAASKIGTTRVASGAGSHPFEITGDVYLTTAYKGAPFGLSIVTDAVAGPFNLGLVIVRSRINVDPTTSALTVTSDPLPQIVFGVPLRLQRVTVNIDRPGFMFNPSNCAAQQITASISGTQQATANVASPFAAAGCRSLAFKPGFTVNTSAHTSKLDGASLDAKVTYPAFQPGSQANIARVKVELPKQLPSRLTTLQKACLAAVFAANPAGCPPGSVVGIARVTTPVLPVPLEGPVYFVSHGGEAFPSLIVVLQGDGVRVDLTGATFISRQGVTSSTFKTVPDVPINSFELYLPEGRFSALAANGDLCHETTSVAVKRRVTRQSHGHTVHRTVTVHVAKPTTLLMPTEFTAQNGAVDHQSTRITVTGCATKARKAGHHGRKASR